MLKDKFTMDQFHNIDRRDDSFLEEKTLEEIDLGGTNPSETNIRGVKSWRRQSKKFSNHWRDK